VYPALEAIDERQTAGPEQPEHASVAGENLRGEAAHALRPSQADQPGEQGAADAVTLPFVADYQRDFGESGRGVEVVACDRQHLLGILPVGRHQGCVLHVVEVCELRDLFAWMAIFVTHEALVAALIRQPIKQILEQPFVGHVQRANVNHLPAR